MSYTLLLNGFLKDNDTGSVIPPTRSTGIGNKIITNLKALGCASEDQTGLIAFVPDGINLIQEERVLISLDEAKTKAHTDIDAAAGEARLKYITSVPGQESTYLIKADQATKFIATGYDVTKIDDYVWIKAECEALGVSTVGTIDTVALKTAVDSIITQQQQWYTVGSAIEKLRRSAKIQISDEIGTTPIEIEAAKTRIQGYVDAAVVAFKVM